MGGTEPVPPILSWKGCSILRRFLTALLLCAGLLAQAMPALALGVLIAGFLVTGITYGFTSIF